MTASSIESNSGNARKLGTRAAAWRRSAALSRCFVVGNRRRIVRSSMLCALAMSAEVATQNLTLKAFDRFDDGFRRDIGPERELEGDPPLQRRHAPVDDLRFRHDAIGDRGDVAVERVDPYRSPGRAGDGTIDPVAETDAAPTRNDPLMPTAILENTSASVF